MRIKKILDAVGLVGNILNKKSDSKKDAYSCDYINKLNTYSTEEQRIGTWIDGKPLYRKVVTISTLIANSSSKYDVDLSDMQTLIHVYGTFVQDNINGENNPEGAFMPLASVVSDKPIYYAGIHTITKDGFYLYSGAGNWVSRNCIVVFEYTKTTD